MNKQDFVDAIAKKTGLKKTEATKALDAFVEVVTSSLVKGEDVRLVGFGTFSVSHRKARTGRNPQTGAALKIPASKVPKFTSGKALKDAVKK